MASPDSDVNSLSSSSSSSSSSAASPANNDVLNGYLKLPNHFVDEGYSNYDDDGSSQECINLTLFIKTFLLTS
jgi:hypothetical protein